MGGIAFHFSPHLAPEWLENIPAKLLLSVFIALLLAFVLFQIYQLIYTPTPQRMMFRLIVTYTSFLFWFFTLEKFSTIFQFNIFTAWKGTANEGYANAFASTGEGVTPILTYELVVLLLGLGLVFAVFGVTYTYITLSSRRVD